MSLNEYYTVLDDTFTTTSSNFMSYIFDYIYSHQPERFEPYRPNDPNNNLLWPTKPDDWDEENGQWDASGTYLQSEGLYPGNATSYKYNYPFIPGDTLNFMVTVNANENQRVFGYLDVASGDRTIKPRKYKLQMTIVK